MRVEVLCVQETLLLRLMEAITALGMYLGTADRNAKLHLLRNIVFSLKKKKKEKKKRRAMSLFRPESVH